MRRIGNLLIVTFCFSLLCGGCGKVLVSEFAAPSVRVEDSRSLHSGSRFNTVNIIDDSLQNEKGGKIAVENTNARRTQTGTVEVWATLRNRTDYPLQIEGRTLFFDRDQRLIDGPTAWQRIYLPPKSIGSYSEFSTRIAEVEYYYVEVREGR